MSDTPSPPNSGLSLLSDVLTTWTWPALASLVLLLACIAGGMSQAAATQALTAISGLIVVVLMLDPRCRHALTRLPDLRLALLGLGALMATWLIQFTPLMVCAPSPPPWARLDMVTIDPQWSVRGIIGFGAALGFVLIGAFLGSDQRGVQALNVALAALLLGVFGHAVWDYLQEIARPRAAGVPDVARLDGAFQSANTLASLWILGLVASAGLYLAEMPRHGGQRRPLARAISAIVALVCFLGLIGSMSRAGIAIGVLMLAVLSVFAWPERKWRLIGLFVGLGAGLALLGTYGASIGLPVRKIDLLGSFLTRLPEWRAAMDLTLQRPCLGWGVGSFPLAVEAVREAPTQSLSLVSVTPHNLVLLITAETGLFGLLAWALLGMGIWRAVQPAFLRRQSIGSTALALGLLSVLLHNGLDFSLAVPATACLFALALGMLLGKATRPTRPKRTQSRPAPAKVLP